VSFRSQITIGNLAFGERLGSALEAPFPNHIVQEISMLANSMSINPPRTAKPLFDLGDHFSIDFFTLLVVQTPSTH
jgi:hypothetical protein